MKRGKGSSIVLISREGGEEEYLGKLGKLEEGDAGEGRSEERIEG